MLVATQCGCARLLAKERRSPPQALAARAGGGGGGEAGASLALHAAVSSSPPASGACPPSARAAGARQAGAGRVSDHAGPHAAPSRPRATAFHSISMSAHLGRAGRLLGALLGALLPHCSSCRAAGCPEYAFRQTRGVSKSARRAVAAASGVEWRRSLRARLPGAETWMWRCGSCANEMNACRVHASPPLHRTAALGAARLSQSTPPRASRSSASLQHEWVVCMRAQCGP